MSSTKSTFREIKKRKLPKLITIYLSTGVTILGVVNLFSGVYHLPMVIFDCALTIIVCGIPSVLTYGWYRYSSEKKQKIMKIEIIIHAVSFLIAAIVILQLTGAAGVRLLPRDSKSIAVLPFKNLSENKEDEYFIDGITEDILSNLSKISGLRVISRTSVMQYKNSAKNIRQISNELDVATILEGSIRRVGNRVRIVGQLINARNDAHIWAETYDRDLKDILAVQTEVAKSIATTLETKLSPLELQQIEKKSTVNLEAYSLYLRGRSYYYNYKAETNERAIELFRKALSIDPKYALAYAGLADAYGRKKYYDYAQKWIDSSFVLSNKAIEIDPNLAEGYKALGDAYDGKNEPRTALDNYLNAVRLNPNYSTAISNIGFINYRLGSFDEALKWMKKAWTVEPGMARLASNVGLQYFSLGFDNEAKVWFKKALELQPEFFFPNIVMTYIDVYAQQYDTARNHIKNIVSAYPNVSAIYTAAGDVEMMNGNFKKAKEYFEKSVEFSSFRSDGGVKLAYVNFKLNNQPEANKILNLNLTKESEDLNSYSETSATYYAAACFCMAKKYQNAIQVLHRAVDLGFRDYRWIQIDPIFDEMRTNPEFISIVSSLKKKMNEMRDRVQKEKI